MGNEPSFTISRDASVVVAKQQDYIGVNKADWARLKKKLNSCKDKTQWWLNASFTLFGIAGSGFFALITLPIKDDESNWVKPTLICISVATLIIGVICLIAHKREGSFSTSRLSDVKEVIQEIDSSLEKNDKDKTD